MKLVIRLPSAINCSTVSGGDGYRWACASIFCISSIMVSANIENVDVSFLKSVPGEMRLTNQLRGRVTLYSMPPRELTLQAIMNSPESLSARSHNTFTSARSPLRRTSLKGNIRRGTYGLSYPVVRTVDIRNQGSKNDASWRSQKR